MVSEKFRRQLRKEAEQWYAEGLIDASVWEQLAQRYRFQALETNGQNRFAAILFGVGALLLGLGIITFVAANWQGWSRGVRAALLLTLFLTVNIGGFWGWHSQQQNRQRWGKALLLFGAFIFGANLALMSQMFHQSGAVYQLCWVWGSGVLAMAYGLQLSWLATLAVVLAGIGYWWAVPTGFDTGRTLEWGWLIPYMPLLTTALFMPLANICQSRWVLVWAVLAAVSSWETTIAQQLTAISPDNAWLRATMAMAGLSLPPLLLWGYPSQATTINFQGISRRLSIVFLAGVFYIFSFHDIGVDWFLDNGNNTTVHYFPVWLQILLFGGLTLYAWLRLGKSRNAPWRLTLTSTLVAVASLLAGLVAALPLLGLTPTDRLLIPIAVYNLLLFLLAIALVRGGLNQGIRVQFWGGLSLLILQIVSRMLEYQTGLMFKSAIFVLCGIAIVIAGLRFERSLGPRG